MKLNKIKVYESGNMITFAYENGAVFTTEPKGTVRILKYSLTGFSFERVVTGETIAYVDSYDDVQDASGAIYGGSFSAVLSALGAFFVPSGSGGGVTGAENGLYVSGGKARLGGSLIENTVITEAGFDFSQIRAETIGAGIVAAAHLCAIDNPLTILGWVETPLTRSFAAQSDLGGSAFAGVTANNTDDAVAYLKQVIGDSESLIYVGSSIARIAAFLAGVLQADINIMGTQITANADVSVENLTTGKFFNTDQVVQQISGKYHYGDPNANNSYRTGVEIGSFVVQRYSAAVWTTYFSASPNEIRLNTLQVTLQTDAVVQNSSGFYYYGNVSTNGSFRVGLVGGVFTVQKRISGVWITQSFDNIANNFLTKEELQYNDDFIMPSISTNWSSSSASGGNIDLTQIGETGVVGIARFTVTNSNGSRYGILTKTGSLVRTYQDGNKFILKTKIRPESLGSGADIHIINIGFLSSVAVNNPIAGCYFGYDFNNTQRVNPVPANWTIVSRVNNTDKVVLNSGVPVAIGVWTKMAIEFDTATNTVNFYINGALTNSIVWNGLTGASSNIPMIGAGTECGWGAIMSNTGSALAKGLRIDYINVYKDFV